MSAVSAGIFEESPAGQVIGRAMEQGRLAHSLLLYGADIETLETFARHIAARLLNTGADWAAGNAGHADYFTLRPAGKIRQIKIGTKESNEPNTMRNFVRQVSQTPMSADRKVGVVFEADRLNPSSANAFLKTLEEPPADTTLLLLTSYPYSLLPTIRSRCLHFRVPSAVRASDDPVLANWIRDYRAWLRGLAGADGEKPSPTRQVMTAYALVARFSSWLENATAAEFARLKEQGTLENLDSDETDAVRSTTAIGIRNRFLAALEQETCAVAREIEGARLAAVESVAAIERAAGLLKLNLNANAALEMILLTILRAWSRKG